jgi:hypothetical protein
MGHVPVLDLDDRWLGHNYRNKEFSLMINKKAEGSPLFNEAPCHEGVRILTSVLN